METELKLLIDPRHANALRKHPLLKKYALAAPQELHMSDTYFDTPDLGIWRQHAGLRVRHVDGGWVQTLKGGGGAAGGLHRRHEWESAVAGPAPDFAMLKKLVDGHKPWAKLLRSTAAGQAVQAIFTTQVTRTIWNLRLATGDEVEFALDQGKLQGDSGQEPVSEIELELKSGQPEQLFAFALQLQRKIPLRIANLSKAQRGYALHSQQAAAPAAVKAEKLELSRHMNTEQAFCAILANCVGQMQANEGCVIGSHDMESLHQLRVGLRRLRSALGLYQELISVPLQTQEDLAWLATQLGPARDWDVLAHTTLAAVADGAAEDIPLAPLNAAALERVAKEHDIAAAAVKSPRYARLMLSLSARAHGVAWSGFGQEAEQGLGKPAAKFAAKTVARAGNRLHKRGKHLHQADAQARHRLRIAAKKLRYATEFFQSLFPSKQVQQYVKALTGLQDGLGQLNDAAIATGLLKQLQQADAGLGMGVSFVRGYLAARAERAKDSLEKRWQELEAMQAPGRT
ncbi:MAG: CHAD domain-containing protein [Pseudomonadota bacterium]